jgi:4-amino-4-deoxy-L-arabinose transferase-like glycosyltransferase
MFKEYLMRKNLPFWLITFSVMILLTVPKLIQDGMFLDGMLYTCVSHNLGNGIGTFWFPEYSPSYLNAGSHFFQEHPPLVFGIQSLFFRLLGDSMYVERFYTFLTMCITAYLINVLWRSIFEKEEAIKKISWLPVLFWITIPSSSWSYSNNMMENTMGIFTLTAVILIFKAVNSTRNRFGALIISGVFVFLATMSKGVTGFFPIALPFLYWIIFRKKPLLNAIIQTLLVVSIPVILYFILFSLPQSHESLSFYLTKRLLGRINDDPTVGNRFYILKRLFNELIPQILVTLLIILTAKLKKIKVPLVSNIGLSIFFFSVGLTAAAPMVLTLVQRGFYLVPSFPYFAIGFSILITPIVLYFNEEVVAKIRKIEVLRILSIVLIVFAIGFSLLQKGKTYRDKDMLFDVNAIGNAIPKNSAITINQDIANTYILECYFIRYYNISLYVDEPKDYLMIKKTMDPPDPGIFEKLDIRTELYDVYRSVKTKKVQPF